MVAISSGGHPPLSTLRPPNPEHKFAPWEACFRAQRLKLVAGVFFWRGPKSGREDSLRKPSEIERAPAQWGLGPGAGANRGERSNGIRLGDRKNGRGSAIQEGGPNSPSKRGPSLLDARQNPCQFPKLFPRARNETHRADGTSILPDLPRIRLGWLGVPPWRRPPFHSQGGEGKESAEFDIPLEKIESAEFQRGLVSRKRALKVRREELRWHFRLKFQERKFT
jgi:hypothetical protein